MRASDELMTVAVQSGDTWSLPYAEDHLVPRAGGEEIPSESDLIDGIRCDREGYRWRKRHGYHLLITVRWSARRFDEKPAVLGAETSRIRPGAFANPTDLTRSLGKKLFNSTHACLPPARRFRCFSVISPATFIFVSTSRGAGYFRSFVSRSSRMIGQTGVAMPGMPFLSQGEFSDLFLSRPQGHDRALRAKVETIKIALLVREFVPVREVEDAELFVMGHVG
jgi:hypothetical protein